MFFNVDEEFAKKIENSGRLLKPVLMDKLELPPPEEQKEEREKFGENFYKTGLDRYKTAFVPIDRIQDIYIKAQGIIEKVIRQVQPDVILLDQLFNLPFVENKSIPYGMIVSANPLYAQNLPNYPPSVSFSFICVCVTDLSSFCRNTNLNSSKSAEWPQRRRKERRPSVVRIQAPQKQFAGVREKEALVRRLRRPVE